VNTSSCELAILSSRPIWTENLCTNSTDGRWILILGIWSVEKGWPHEFKAWWPSKIRNYQGINYLIVYSETCEIRTSLGRAKSVSNSEVSSFHRAICTENSIFGTRWGVLISQDILILNGCYSQVCCSWSALWWRQSDESLKMDHIDLMKVRLSPVWDFSSELLKGVSSNLYYYADFSIFFFLSKRLQMYFCWDYWVCIDCHYTKITLPWREQLRQDISF
jgi:hypothetical protein